MAIAKAKNYQIGWVAYRALEHADSFDDCLHIADVCGYKKGWAYYKWRDREKKISSKVAGKNLGKFTHLI